MKPNPRYLTPQQQQVLDHLLAGKHITPLEAQMLYRVRQLPTVIFYLKKKGFSINRQLTNDVTGHRYARYSLAAE